ncbi:hypothetical protein [Streptomyces sp. NPDC052494]|uniref:hypothetical protein n=1 Tax=Streptomyces sp. NPDC052494 TaxID=3365692 RepID=UPI0037CFAAE5
MRTPTRLTKIALTLALGSVALTACGTEGSTGKTVAGVPAAIPTPTPERMISGDALETHPDPEVRVLALHTRIANECEPGSMPELPALPAVDDISETVGPEQPTESPEPVPLPPDLPEPPSAEPTYAGPPEEVPLTGIDKCIGDAHAERIRKAFGDTPPADYAELKKKLAALNYLPESVHRMPDHGGEPRARVDLGELTLNVRMVLDVTATTRGVAVDAFGASVEQDVDITEVKRKPAADAPTT